MSGPQAQRWELDVGGRRHRVEVVGSFSRTVRWHVDGRLVATKRSSEDHLRLRPGDGLDAGDEPDLGALRLSFSSLGRPRRVTWYDPDTGARALLGVGGLDLDPEPGSPAARHEQRVRQHPRRYAALTVAGGVATIVLPLLLGLLAVRLAVALPWPDWHLPSVPWPDVDLPSVPLPDVDLPDWALPGWLSRVADALQLVWPVVLAVFLARAEVRRRRRQDELKARLREQAARPPSDDPG